MYKIIFSLKKPKFIRNEIIFFVLNLMVYLMVYAMMKLQSSNNPINEVNNFIIPEVTFYISLMIMLVVAYKKFWNFLIGFLSRFLLILNKGFLYLLITHALVFTLEIALIRFTKIDYFKDGYFNKVNVAIFYFVNLLIIINFLLLLKFIKKNWKDNFSFETKL